MAVKMNKYDRTHLTHLSKYQRQIDSLYRRLIQEAALLGASVDGLKGDSLFSFDDYPALRKRAERLIEEMRSGMSAVIVNGVNAEWTLANNKNSELARTVFGDKVERLSQAQYRRYFSTNDKAREAFLSRKEAGLNLSDRVWRYTDQFKGEIELGLDVGIRNGMSAQEMSRELRAWLREPDKLFRRVKDERGELKPSRAMAAYHPGQGVYRSSYKNARRLAATETNIAYRTADYERWQQLPFVVGIRVVLSNNHPVPDICDELSAPVGSTANNGRGCYPKDFKFTGWHPHCRCHAESILKTEEEMAEDTRRILAGEEPATESSQTVDDVPQEFKDWLKENAERSKSVYSKPYFVTDNKKYIPSRLLEAYGSKLPYPTYAEYEQAMTFNRAHANFTPEQKKNIQELNEALPVIQGQIMPFGLADNAHPNPLFSSDDALEKGYRHNCQTCTVAYELRRRGYDVEAKPNPNLGKLGVDIREVDVYYATHGMGYESRFLDKDGSPVTKFQSGAMADTDDAKRLFIEGHTAEKGRYEVYCQWKTGSAHVFIVERQKNGNLVWYDPQSSKIATFKDSYLSLMKSSAIEVARIDNALINPEFAKRLIKSK